MGSHPKDPSCLSKQKEKQGRLREWNAMLFLGGSFNPIHRNHINVLNTIKQFLEEHYNLKVVYGHLIPSTQKHVETKLKCEAMPFEQRRKLCQIAASNANTQSITNCNCNLGTIDTSTIESKDDEKHGYMNKTMNDQKNFQTCVKLKNNFTIYVSNKEHHSSIDYATNLMAVSNANQPILLVFCMGQDVAIRYNNRQSGWKPYFDKISKLTNNIARNYKAITIVLKRNGYDYHNNKEKEKKSEMKLERMILNEDTLFDCKSVEMHEIYFLNINDQITISSSKIRNLIKNYNQNKENAQKQSSYFNQLLEMMDQDVLECLLQEPLPKQSNIEKQCLFS